MADLKCSLQGGGIPSLVTDITTQEMNYSGMFYKLYKISFGMNQLTAQSQNQNVQLIFILLPDFDS
jgi:hypothetical protein